MCADKTRQEARQEMYKNHNRSSCWKEKFRERCLERLKDRKSRYLHSRRSLDKLHENDLISSNTREKQQNDCKDERENKKVTKLGMHETISDLDMIMREEFDRMKVEIYSENIRISTGEGDFNNCDIKNSKGNHYQDVNYDSRDYNISSSNNIGTLHIPCDINKDNCLIDIVSWYEEIYETLIAELKNAEEEAEEFYLQSACDDHLKHLENELCSAIQTLSTLEVICPLCERFNLTEQKNIICCKCGLRLDVEQDSITLRHVKDSLTAGTEEHSQKCELKPVFSLNHKFGISNLLMSCHNCDFLFVIV